MKKDMIEELANVIRAIIFVAVILFGVIAIDALFENFDKIFP